MKTYSVLWYLIPWLCTACSDVPESVSEMSGELLGAETDSHHAFDVGLCMGPLVPEGMPRAGTCDGAMCSGTLIAPNLVLTAQHCVRQIAFADPFCNSRFTNTPLAAPISVTASPSVLTGAPSWTTIQSVLLPPGRSPCADDVALLLLSQPIPSQIAVPARVDLNRDYAAWPAAEVAIVGRGAIGELLDLETFHLTIKDGGAQRRILEHVRVECAINGTATCDLVDYSSPPGNRFASPSSFIVIAPSLASGDSGAGVFDQVSFQAQARAVNLQAHSRFGAPAVMGVASAITIGGDGRANHGLVSRIDTHREFILDGLEAAAHALGLGPEEFAKQAR